MRTALLLAALLLTACARPPAGLTVSAAASLQNPLQDLAPLWKGIPLVFNFGGSGTLAQQIENGAPADVFFAAGLKPMHRISYLISGGSRHLLTNEIVLVVPRDRPRVSNFRDLASPGVVLVALGDPGSVPAGEYGEEVLTSMGMWPAVGPKLVLAKDVRQVLTYVETGNADAGLVYATDAADAPGVRIAEVAPPGSHSPIIYPAAVIQNSRHPAEARAFLDFLASPAARAVFERHGFHTVQR